MGLISYFKILNIYFYFLPTAIYLHVCMLKACGLVAYGGQRRAADLLELDIQMVVICHVGAENQTQILCMSNKCF